MIGSVFSRRNVALAGLAVLLAGCQVIPGGGPDSGPGPAPTEGPSDTQLPTDEQRHRVALLVPLSGSNGEVGQSISNAATMALLDTNANNLRITTYDTSSGAGAAASRAISDGNKLILGPMLGDNVTAVLAQARPAGVPLISFSNNMGVAERDVFVMGHIPEQSITRTVDYVRSQGARNFAALLPNGAYGQRADAAMANAVRAAGGNYVAVERFDRGNTSVVSAAERLAAKGGFDAVLIADGPRIAALAARELREGRLPTIIGTELWSGEASVTESPSLDGSLFSAVPDGRFRQFSSAYRTRFGGAPYRISTLGYDSVLLTLRIARDWQPGRPFPISRMTEEGGFLGLDGPFRFREDGVGERAMEVRRAQDGSIAVASPAPDRFD